MKLNLKCKEVKASKLQRDSVPQGLQNVDQIELILEELKKSSEPWKKMKLVVLGHGRIGKTTLLKAVHNLLDPSVTHKVTKSAAIVARLILLLYSLMTLQVH